MRVLFDNGKLVGEVEDWVQNERQAENRVVLGKEVLMPKSKDQVTFTSPKVVNRKSELVVVVDKKLRLKLTDIKVNAGTYVTATVAEQTSVNG